MTRNTIFILLVTFNFASISSYLYAGKLSREDLTKQFEHIFGDKLIDKIEKKIILTNYKFGLIKNKDNELYYNYRISSSDILHCFKLLEIKGDLLEKIINKGNIEDSDKDRIIELKEVQKAIYEHAILPNATYGMVSKEKIKEDILIACKRDKMLFTVFLYLKRNGYDSIDSYIRNQANLFFEEKKNKKSTNDLLSFIGKWTVLDKSTGDAQKGVSKKYEESLYKLCDSYFIRFLKARLLVDGWIVTSEWDDLKKVSPFVPTGRNDEIKSSNQKILHHKLREIISEYEYKTIANRFGFRVEFVKGKAESLINEWLSSGKCKSLKHFKESMKYIKRTDDEITIEIEKVKKELYEDFNSYLNENLKQESKNKSFLKNELTEYSFDLLNKIFMDAEGAFIEHDEEKSAFYFGENVLDLSSDLEDLFWIADEKAHNAIEELSEELNLENNGWTQEEKRDVSMQKIISAYQDAHKRLLEKYQKQVEGKKRVEKFEAAYGERLYSRKGRIRLGMSKKGKEIILFNGVKWPISKKMAEEIINGPPVSPRTEDFSAIFDAFENECYARAKSETLDMLAKKKDALKIFALLLTDTAGLSAFVYEQNDIYEPIVEELKSFRKFNSNRIIPETKKMLKMYLEKANNREYNRYNKKFNEFKKNFTLKYKTNKLYMSEFITDKFEDQVIYFFVGIELFIDHLNADDARKGFKLYTSFVNNLSSKFKIDLGHSSNVFRKFVSYKYEVLKERLAKLDLEPTTSFEEL